jgi:3-oxoacyl-[acyl-carrier protein] reductase
MLANKTAVITGCGVTESGSGLGAHYALELARQGARVVLTDITLERMATTFEKFRQEGLNYRHIELDLAAPDSADKLMEFAHRVYGSVDILVNNAGVVPNTRKETEVKADMYLRRRTGQVNKPLSVLNITDSEWSRFWEVNVHAAFRCLRAACKYMAEQKHGRIINIASISAFSDSGGFSPGYAASKAAVHALTMNVAEECARHGILVNTFAPSGVACEEWLRKPAIERAQIEAGVPIGRQATYGEYAKVVTLLAGDHYFVGQLLSPNGGLVI